MKHHRHPVTLSVLAGLASFAQTALQAEDADRVRPYLMLHYGEMSAPWGVHDYWSVAVGANLDRHWGVELNMDSFQEFPVDNLGRTFGEESLITIMPQVRYRMPFAGNRVVPYVIAGVGPSVANFTDRKPPGFGRAIDIDDLALGVAVGGGVDFFIGDGVALNVEAKYLWISQVSGSIDGAPVDYDFSNFLLSAGLRVFWDENHPAPFNDSLEKPSARYFFGARFGGAAITDGDWTDSAGVVRPASVFLKTFAQNGGISLGMVWDHNLGAELALDLWEPNLNYAPYGTIGEYAVRSIVPQLTLRFPLDGGRWVPYLSAGLGVAHGEFNDRKEPGVGLAIDATGIYPAIRAGGGLEYFVNSGFSLNLGLQWMHTWNHTISINGGAEESGSIGSLQAQLGFRVYFPTTRPR